MSGYSASRACDELEWLLEEDRWKTVGKGFTKGSEFFATINYSEFKFAAEQRKKLIQKMASIEGATQRSIGKTLGVSEATVNRGLVTNVTDHENGPESNQDTTANTVTNVTTMPLISNSGIDAANQLRRHQETKERRQAKDNQQKADLQTVVEIRSPGIIVGDFREKSTCIGDSSVELIFTDPPYDRASLGFYADIASIGERILKPGGSLIAYCGQYLLPQILPMMQDYLRFWWLNACLHSGPEARMNAYGIVVGWKPLVWFVKDDRGDRQTFISDVVSGDREKTHHEWQQAESEASYYIEKLTSQSGLVVDFFTGGGTTCVAAQKLGRPWIAFEINPVVAKDADDRIQRI